MKVTLLKPIGYCQGVIEAINQSFAIKEKHINQNVYVFGHLVHNDDVIEELKEKGIISLDVSKKDPLELLESFSANDVVIFTAHGHPKLYEKILDQKQVTYYDTTCKNVNDNMKIIKENLGRGVIYIGKNNHPETIAALSIDKDVVLYDINEGINFDDVKTSSPIIVNQTTLSILEIYHIHQDIIKHIPGAKFYDEVCSATRVRQVALKDIDDEYDLILVVGSIKSSNTDKLYQIAKENQNIDVYKIDNLNSLRDLDLSNYHQVLITSGTSTPYRVIKEIKDYLERI